VYTESTIQRFYYQGREAVIALVRRLEDQLEDARAQLGSHPESLIALLRKELQSVKRTLALKSDELLRERQLNYQLRRRVHELEREIASGAFLRSCVQRERKRKCLTRAGRFTETL
jgi:DNA repair exonuclease SbcCD ATPase subunit